SSRNGGNSMRQTLLSCRNPTAKATLLNCRRRSRPQGSALRPQAYIPSLEKARGELRQKPLAMAPGRRKLDAAAVRPTAETCVEVARRSPEPHPGPEVLLIG